jgi:hypothetical protein
MEAANCYHDKCNRSINITRFVKNRTFLRLSWNNQTHNNICGQIKQFPQYCWNQILPFWNSCYLQVCRLFFWYWLDVAYFFTFHYRLIFHHMAANFLTSNGDYSDLYRMFQPTWHFCMCCNPANGRVDFEDG